MIFVVATVDLSQATPDALNLTAKATLSGKPETVLGPAVAKLSPLFDALSDVSARRIAIELSGEDMVPWTSFLIEMPNKDNRNDHRVGDAFKKLGDFVFGPPARWYEHQDWLITGKMAGTKTPADVAKIQALADAQNNVPAGSAASVVIVPNPTFDRVAQDAGHWGPPSFRKLVAMAQQCQSITVVAHFGPDPTLDCRLVAKDESTAKKIKAAIAVAASESSRKVGLRPDDEFSAAAYRLLSLLKPSSDGAVVQFQLSGRAAAPMDTLVARIAKPLNDGYINVEDAAHLQCLYSAIGSYAGAHNSQFPHALADMAQSFNGGGHSLAEALTNPRTGDEVGYAIVPQPQVSNDRLWGQPIPAICELRIGKRDPDGLVCNYDGTVTTWHRAH